MNSGAVPVTLSVDNGKVQFKVASPSSWVKYRMSQTFVEATGDFTSEPELPRKLGSSRPRFQGSLIVAPLMDGWKQKCDVRGREFPHSDRTAPFSTGRNVREDHSWRSDLQSPSFAEGHKSMRFAFNKSCRLLDTERLQVWREFQKQVTGQAMHKGNMAQVHDDCRKKELWTNESESTLFPTSSRDSTLSATGDTASTSVYLDLVKNNGFFEGTCAPNSGASISRGFKTAGNSVLQHNHLATPHFGMSVVDFDELEVVPSDRPVIDCS